MYFFIVFLVYNFHFSTETFTCNPDKKIRYGSTYNGPGKCTIYGACHESGLGCYFSQENIPGFRLINGESTSCQTNETLSNLKRNECAQECLKRSECNHFTYDLSSRDCLIKTTNCNDFNYQNGRKLTYKRHASRRVMCTYADCVHNDLGHGDLNVEQCSDKCKNTAGCKLFALVTTSTLARSCIVKSVLCDFTLPENSKVFVSICIPGPVFPDWLRNHYSNRAEISDDSKSTCKIVGSEDNFNLKIPWPTVGENKPDFNITIFGLNLQKCFDYRHGLQENGVIAYVMFEFHSKPQFIGNFKACKIINGNDSTECKYTCSCASDFCEAVHIRAFATDNIAMSICHYEISQD